MNPNEFNQWAMWRSAQRALIFFAAMAVTYLLGLGVDEAFAFAAIGDVTIEETTSKTTLQKAWKKVQAPLVKAFRSRNEVWKWLKDAPPYTSIDYSAREMLIPLHISKQGGAAHIDEFGYQANPYTNAPQEITVNWTILSQRFAASLTAKRLDKQQKGRRGQIVRQFKYQAMQAMDSVSNRVTQTAFGYSTAVVCKVASASNVSGNQWDLTLKDAYGEANLDDAAFLAGFFAVKDRICLERSGSLVSNSIPGVVNTVTESTGVIRVTFPGSLTPTANDVIKFANNALDGISAYTLADHTDDDLWPVGMMDALKSTTVHGLASTTEENWAAGYANSSGGRLSRLTIRKMRQGIKNNGGGRMTDLWLDEQVENDFLESQEATLRVSGTKGLKMDLGTTDDDFRIRSSDRVPPGFAIGFDRNNSFHRFMGMDMPESDDAGLGWEDGEKVPNQSAMTFDIEFEYGYVTTNRGNLAYAEGLTRQ